MTTFPITVASLDDERLIRDGENAAEAFAKSGRENILPMVRGLLAARRKYPATMISVAGSTSRHTLKW